MKKLLLAIAVSMAVISLPVFSNAVDGDTDVGSDDKNVNLDADHDWDWMVTDSLGEHTLEQEGEVNEGEPDPDPAGDTYMWREGISWQGLVPVVEDFDFGQTRTTFRGEIASTSDIINDDDVLRFRLRERVRVASELIVDEDDVGRTAKCMVVAGYSSTVGDDTDMEYFMLSDDGWVGWNGSLSELNGVECELAENHKIIAHDDELFSGEFKLFFGYQLLVNGKIVYGPEALSFRVE